MEQLILVWAMAATVGLCLTLIFLWIVVSDHREAKRMAMINDIHTVKAEIAAIKIWVSRIEHKTEGSEG